MPHRHHHWPLIALVVPLLSCTLFHKPTDFEKGLKRYQAGDYERAARLFDTYAKRYPAFDTGLYYLCDCYARLGRTEERFRALAQLAGLHVEDINIYLNLIDHERSNGRWSGVVGLLCGLPPGVTGEYNRRFILTRRGYAELACGAAGINDAGNPLVGALTRGYLNSLPDGFAYPDDTVTLGNLIILLDRLVPPDPPRSYPALQTLDARSYLYLPYLRLVGLGIIDYEPALDPDRPATPVECARALVRLKNAGHLR